MSLIFISLFFGFIGFCLGAATGEESFMILFVIIGTLSPSVYVLDKLNKGSSTKISNMDIDGTIEFLRNEEILTESEFKKATFVIDNRRKEAEKKRKYNQGITILEGLSSEKVISESDLNDKIKMLKNSLNEYCTQSKLDK